MKRLYQRWHSPSLGRDMELQIFGHAGAKLLVFPTSLGTHREWPDRRMHVVLRDHLENGWVQMYTLDQVHGESWYDDRKHPGARAWRQLQYDEYVYREVVPLTYAKNRNDFIIAAGASFGAYHAAAIAFRHPHLFGRMLGMSGLYDIKEQTGGYSDDDVYFSNPVNFIANEHDPGRLEALRRQDIIIAIGRDDPMRPNNEWMSHVLWSRGIGHALRIWDGWAHDWPYWHRMLALYIGGHD